MKQFILKVFFVLSPILLLVIGVNYFGDAANLFKEGFEKKVAKELNKGQNVTNVYNYDERLLQKYMIHDLNYCPEIVVLGSSRVMLLNSNDFKGQSFYNAGVSSSSFEDILVMFEFFQQKNCLPKKIIIGLDPWTLNANNGQTRWTAYNKEYNSIFKLLMNKESSIHENWKDSKYLQLVSPSYFKSSYKNLFAKSLLPISTKKPINTSFTRHPDGSISYDSIYRSVTPDELVKHVVDYISGDVFCVEKFEKLSPEIELLLEKFIIYLKTKKCEVTILMAPYHPDVYDFISKTKKYQNVIKSETYFRRLASKQHIKIIGSFNPKVLKLDKTYFYDGMHCNEKGIEKILKN